MNANTSMRSRYDRWSTNEVRAFSEWYETEDLDSVAKVFNLANTKSVCGTATTFRNHGIQVPYRRLKS